MRPELLEPARGVLFVELWGLVLRLPAYAPQVHDSTRDLIHALDLFLSDLRMGRVSLGASRAVLLREALRLIKFDITEESLLRRRQSYKRARVVACELDALRSDQRVTAPTSGSHHSD